MATHSTPRWMLALDASTPHSVLALGRIDGAVPMDENAAVLHFDDEENRANQASDRLVPRIEALAQRAGVPLRELSALVCGRGPGTFTGTRVGLATAKGLGFAIGCPVYATSTVAALAASAPLSITADTPAIAMLDARRSEVYGAAFTLRPPSQGRAVARLTDDACGPIEAIVETAMTSLGEGALPRLYGPGADAYRERVPEALRGQVFEAVHVTPAGLWTVALDALRHDEPVALATLDARYLRPSYAEMGATTPKRPTFRSPFL